MPTKPVINIRMIDHVVLRVRDLPNMMRFYCDVLGCTLERGPGDYGLAQLRAGNSLIDLAIANTNLAQGSEELPDRSRNMDHFCVQIEPWNPAAIIAMLDENDVSRDDVAERYGALGNGPSIYLKDPEGNTVELKGPPSK